MWRELAAEKAYIPVGTQCFVSEKHIDSGCVPWVDEAGDQMDCWRKPPARTPGATGPVGVALKTVPAKLIGPLSEMDLPWETNYNMYFATVVYEEEKYRAWYSCVPKDYYDAKTGALQKGHGQVLCYAESRDGFHWEKPSLDLYPYQGTPTNIVYGRELCPYGFQSGSVFVDDHGPKGERYKLFFLGIKEYDGEYEKIRRRFAERFKDSFHPKSLSVQNGKTVAKCMFFAVSADGIRWKTEEEPSLMLPSDTLNTCRYDPLSQSYIAYVRVWKNGRRVVSRVQSDDYHCFSQKPVVVLEPDLSWPLSLDVYTNSRVNYPDSNEVMMFPGVYDRFEDRRKVFFAVSEDDHSWSWAAEPCIRDCGRADGWDAGDLNPGTGMVYLGEDRVALPVMVCDEPHKYPRTSGSSLGKLGWLTWERGRIGCICAERVGEFSTPPMICTGTKLLLNLETVKRSGVVQVEIQAEDGKPIPGFTMSEADPITGNELAHCVTWKGNDNLSCLLNRVIKLRLYLRLARIYSFEFKK